MIAEHEKLKRQLEIDVLNLTCLAVEAGLPQDKIVAALEAVLATERGIARSARQAAASYWPSGG